MARNVRVAAAHLAPVYMDAGSTADKTCDYIKRAAEQGVALAVFPESFIPGFPLWSAVSPPISNHDFFNLLVRQSIRVPGPEILKVCAAAREHKVIVSLGISESTGDSSGCLWNTNLLIGDDGSILNHHRKLVPTFFEKMVWATGDGHGLRVVDTPVGRVGSLICGENTNPLARFAVMAQGEEIHTSSYPPTWPTHIPDNEERYDLASAIRIRGGAHSFEAKVFNIIASSRLSERTFEILAPLGEQAREVIERTPKGISMIIGPSGTPVCETTTDEDQLLVADIDLDDCITPKQFHDLTGYYNRFDIFDLHVNRDVLKPVAFNDVGGGDRRRRFEELEDEIEMGEDVA